MRILKNLSDRQDPNNNTDIKQDSLFNRHILAGLMAMSLSVCKAQINVSDQTQCGVLDSPNYSLIKSRFLGPKQTSMFNSLQYR